MRKSSNNDEESIVAFARVSSDQKKWIFSLVTQEPSDGVAEVPLRPQSLHFHLLTLVCLTWPSRHLRGDLPPCLASYPTVHLILSYCPNSASPVLYCHFSHVILPLKIILVQMPLDLRCHHTFSVQNCNSSFWLCSKIICRMF